MARLDVPLPLTSFVGRTVEVSAVRRLLDVSRLVTLVGAGGVGKTRLALEVARQAANAFSGGVVFVPLASIEDVRLVVPSIAQALGVQELGGRPLLDSVADEIGGRALLLVLDNLEQVLATGTDIGGLLLRTTALRVLVTSRAPLHVTGEHTFDVPPLDLPLVEGHGVVDIGSIRRSSATRLFVDRAGAASSAFTLTPEAAPTVAAICRRLDGLPLAIELAAARTRHLPATSLLDRLDRRFAVLTGGPRDAPTRQQTLRSAISWSYDLLDRAEQRLFCWLGVFSGGFTVEAVEAVAGEPAALDLLAALMDQSLIRQDTSHAQPGQPARFMMLETIRELSMELLEASGEATTAHQRHAEYFTRFAEATEPDLRSHRQHELIARLAADLDNLRAVLSWAKSATGGAEIQLRVVGVLGWFWHIRGQNREGRRAVQEALETQHVGDPHVRTTRATAIGPSGGSRRRPTSTTRPATSAGVHG
jgi:predicted ATPase